MVRQVCNASTPVATVYHCMSCREHYERPDVMYSYAHKGVICSLNERWKNNQRLVLKSIKIQYKKEFHNMELFFEANFC